MAHASISTRYPSSSRQPDEMGGSAGLVVGRASLGASVRRRGQPSVRRQSGAWYTGPQERSNGGERLLAVVSGAVRRTLAFPPVQRHELRGIGGGCHTTLHSLLCAKRRSLRREPILGDVRTRVLVYGPERRNRSPPAATSYSNTVGYWNMGSADAEMLQNGRQRPYGSLAPSNLQVVVKETFKSVWSGLVTYLTYLA